MARPHLIYLISLHSIPFSDLPVVTKESQPRRGKILMSITALVSEHLEVLPEMLISSGSATQKSRICNFSP